MRRTRIFMVVCFAFLLAATTKTLAQTQDVEYKKSLKEMMTLSGGLASAEAMIPQMMTMIKQTAPSVPEAFWDALTAKWTEKFTVRMVELYVPVYQKYFTLDELKQIVAFYETPIGRKLGASTPAISLDGMQLGQQLGLEMVSEIQEEIAAQGKESETPTTVIAPL